MPRFVRSTTFLFDANFPQPRGDDFIHLARIFGEIAIA